MTYHGYVDKEGRKAYLREYMRERRLLEELRPAELQAVMTENHVKTIRQIVENLSRIEEKAEEWVGGFWDSDKLTRPLDDRLDQWVTCMETICEAKKFPYYVAAQVCNRKFLGYGEERNLLKYQHVRESSAFDQVVVWSKEEDAFTQLLRDVVYKDKVNSVAFGHALEEIQQRITVKLYEGKSDAQILAELQPHDPRLDWSDIWTEEELVQYCRRRFEEERKKEAAAEVKAEEVQGAGPPIEESAPPPDVAERYDHKKRKIIARIKDEE